MQNEDKSISTIGLCRNLAKSIKRNALAALDCDLSRELNYPGFEQLGPAHGIGRKGFYEQ